MHGKKRHDGVADDGERKDCYRDLPYCGDVIMANQRTWTAVSDGMVSVAYGTHSRGGTCYLINRFGDGGLDSNCRCG